MRVLFISKEGDGLGVAQRLAYEGVDVSLWCPQEEMSRALVGIINRPRDWRGAARRADLIVADSVGMGGLASALPESAACLGFSPELDAIELDRSRGMALFTRAGIDTPETHEFATVAEARATPHKQGWGDGWVVKASGNASNSLSHVVKDEEMWDRAVSTLPPASHGIVQRVVSGVEVSTEGWFNGNDFITPFNHTFEEKKFLNGNLGPTTGCMGNIVIGAESNRLTRATVERVGDLLRMLKYRGPFDINCIVNERGAYALEATSRMGYDAVEALLEGLDCAAGDFLLDVATGRMRTMPLTDDAMIAVRLTVPPFPNRKIAKTEYGQPIRGINEDTLRHLFLTDVALDNGEYVLSACDGTVLKATATGKPRMNGNKMDYTYESRRRVYRALDKINVRDKQYRTDIGARVNADIERLKEWGWI